MVKENHFEDKVGEVGVTLRWSNLVKVIQDANVGAPKNRYAVLKSVMFGDSVAKNATLSAGGRVILNNVSGEALPGQVLGIMGPSGAGKTTLLNVLAGRATYDNGIYRSFKNEKDKKKMAYITQKDVFFKHLTVRDQLVYTALLRLAGTKQEKINEVDRIVQLLRLEKCQNTPIKLISGGESKRVNIGSELLTNPSVILLDEPTSGLDSTSAVSLLRTLREDLALKHNKTIITSIHQPSSPIFSQALDKIMFLADGGYVVYDGTPANSLIYLRNILRMPCPEGYNAADHWMDLLVGTDTDTTNLLMNDRDDFKDEEEKKEDSCFNINKMEEKKDDLILPSTSKQFNKQAIEIDVEAGVAKNKQRHQSSVLFGANSVKEKQRRQERASELAETQRKAITEAEIKSIKSILISRWESFKLEDRKNSQVSGDTTIEINGESGDNKLGKSKTPKYPISWWSQYKILTHRAFKNSKEAIFTPLNITKSILLGIIAGLMWFQMDNAEKYIHDRSSYIYFTTMFWIFDAMFGAIFAFPMERGIIFKERASGSYNLSAYFLAKTTSEAPTMLSLPTMFFIISYWMANINNSFLKFIATLFVVLLSSFAGESLGLVCGALVMDFESAMTAMIVISLTMMLSGGFFVEKMPSFFSWVKYLSPFKYSFDAARQLIFDQDVICDGSKKVCQEISQSIATPEQVKDYLNVDGSFGFNVGILFCIFVIPRYIALLALQRKKAGERL